MIGADEKPVVRDFMAERSEERMVKVSLGPPQVLHEEGVYLQDWIMAHDAWETAAHSQVRFMRDQFTGLINGHYNGWRPEGPKVDRAERTIIDRAEYVSSDPNFDNNCMVVGEHVSKSVRLPVYSLRSLRLGLEMRLRYNFYDWKCSIRAIDPAVTGVLDTFGDLISRKNGDGYPQGEATTISDCYLEGFTKDWSFGPPHPTELRDVTIETYNNYTLWTVGWLLRDQPRTIPEEDS